MLEDWDCQNYQFQAQPNCAPRLQDLSSRRKRNNMISGADTVTACPSDKHPIPIKIPKSHQLEIVRASPPDSSMLQIQTKFLAIPPC